MYDDATFFTIFIKYPIVLNDILMLMISFCKIYILVQRIVKYFSVSAGTLPFLLRCALNFLVSLFHNIKYTKLRTLIFRNFLNVKHLKLHNNLRKAKLLKKYNSRQNLKKRMIQFYLRNYMALLIDFWQKSCFFYVESYCLLSV